MFPTRVCPGTDEYRNDRGLIALRTTTSPLCSGGKIDCEGACGHRLRKFHDYRGAPRLSPKSDSVFRHFQQRPSSRGPKADHYSVRKTVSAF